LQYGGACTRCHGVSQYADAGPCEAWGMAVDHDEDPGELPVDPLLGQPRMVDDPRISIAQAAVVLGKKPAQVHRFIALGRLPRHGLPNNGRPLLLSEVEALATRANRSR
jgi:hypothetical protein